MGGVSKSVAAEPPKPIPVPTVKDPRRKTPGQQDQAAATQAAPDAQASQTAVRLGDSPPIMTG